MTLVVIDTGVLVSGVFWRHGPHLCLKAWLVGVIVPVVSDEIVTEYGRVLEEVKTEQGFDTGISLWLETLRSGALSVSPVELPARVCCDPSDDKFIAAALAAGAKTVIARDPDLTSLEKPFGISILTPRAWLASLPRQQRRKLG